MTGIDATTVLESIMTTRAMRRYTDEPVSDDDIATCLRAAQQAPSGGNVQPQQYMVVTDASTRTALGDIYRRAYDRYERTLPTPESFADEAQAEAWRRNRDASRHLADHLADAPVLVLFLQPIVPWGGEDEEGPLDIGRLDASVYPAVQNFCLAARALGLGSALTTVVRINTADVFELLGVPTRSDGRQRFEIAALVPVGHPSGSFGVAPRKPAAKVTHWNRWGEQRP
ncbi:MAG TPA: nitroreductase family protein [Ilumatobacteraceae bacterium]|nr:nitroreductase family protein [Ilumatobacteraceae bacterium]